MNEYIKALEILYEALKGAEIEESVDRFKSWNISRNEMEQNLRELISASTSYSPIPYTKTMGDIYKHRELYSDDILDSVYKGQTEYMMFDRQEFGDLVRRISYDDSFDFFKYIDNRWRKFVTSYMKKH